MLSFTECTLYLVIILVGFVFLFGRRRKNYPPGPRQYPIIGNIFELGDEFNTAFWKQKEKYGPISSFKFGLKNAICLHDVNLIKEAFAENVFSGRPQSTVTDFIAGANDGILQGNGKLWAEQRRFALRTLRDFGFGKKSMESTIMDEVEELMDWVSKQGGKPIRFHGRINLAVVNALWTILTGARYEHDDPKLVKIIQDLELVITALMKGKGMALLVGFYPSLAKLIPNWSGWNYLTSLAKVRTDLFDRIIKEHRENRSEGHVRDFIDVYLSEIDKTEDTTSSFHHSTAYKSLQSIMSDFFVAGSDTTSTTLNWAFLYLVHHTEIQKKLQCELDRVVGNSRPTLADRNRLPYMEAFLMEVQRYASILPLAVAHETLEDVELHGYSIPKGTVVMSNLYAVHYDPNIWSDPKVFRPERFLSPDGLTLQRNDCLIPFGTGKRICLGFNLALDQLFLFISCIVQRFDISSEAGKPKPTLEPKKRPN